MGAAVATFVWQDVIRTTGWNEVKWSSALPPAAGSLANAGRLTLGCYPRLLVRPPERIFNTHSHIQ